MVSVKITGFHVVVVVLSCLAKETTGALNCPKLFSVISDPDNCRYYVQCVFGNPVPMPCPGGLAFSTKDKSCVYLKNSDCSGGPVKPKPEIRRPRPVLLTNPIPSKFNMKTTTRKTTTTTTQPTTDKTTTQKTTTQKTTTEALEESTERPRPVKLLHSIEEECLRNPRAKFHHPTECAQYYDCSVIYKNIPKYFEQFLVECPYPQLFNDRSSRCDSHNRVKCGRRREVKEPCDYIQNLCQTANCRPCSARFPSCGNRPDGVNAWGQREWTPYFVKCAEGRLMDQGLCEQNRGYPTLFSPESKNCVSVFSVPKKFGGYQPDCGRKRNGFYPDENGKCGLYFQCQDYEFRDTFECPSGRVFDPDSSLCKYASLVRGRCGRR